MQHVSAWLNKHNDIILYLLFGVLTTAVNWIVYFLLLHFIEISAVVCNAVAWFIAVLFAFVTNKLFVFKSTNWHLKKVLTEAAAFWGCRLITGIFESFIILFFVDILNRSGFLWKIIASTFVLVFNYIGSKRIIFA